MKLVAIESGTLGVSGVCAALSIPRASFYRHRRPRVVKAPRLPPARALSAEERRAALAVLHEPRFVDKAPAEVYATLLDAGRYLCSERTMYRLLEADDEVRDRRDILRHKNHPKPELLARAPTNFGVGISRSFMGQRSGRTFICMSLSTSSVDMRSAGWWPTPSLRRWLRS